MALLARPPRVLTRIFRMQAGMRPPSQTYMAPKLQLIYYRLRAFLREECGKQNDHRSNYRRTYSNDIEEFRKAFQFFDANHDGYITADELERAMNKCGVYPNKLELRMIMSQGDKDSTSYRFFHENHSILSENGVITFDEFIHLMQSQVCNSKYNERQLRDQFNLFDKDHDGFIERGEMRSIVRELSLGRYFPDHVIEQLFNEADIDGDGKISFQEFVLSVN
ncbi:Protein K03A1.4 a [Aphelenchoides avenae]|nr:Protein K03A1.4 a [Aphelenchus avenae]